MIDSENLRTAIKPTIKPCPFCGMTANALAAGLQLQLSVQIKPLPDEEFAVCCGYCGTTGPIEIGEHEAILLWNHRNKTKG